ncbi:hypothetical protein M2132_000163 [Dysgonomonas sp. PH5-45]|uniref:DUF3108 domain-containing protein n=1 Tax=unclassified Dysgonomonas TaxID=2630389 RepID=UPI002474A01A|nr:MULTISPECIES: DUF3108 domain-containing protein [unclassified Dysgonomonas]MDH6353846.1 hypothetical protein [Dysgonomonas sp. PH5-45]MDH6386748.1 hypothetical protein [Dysgonomonas sp. PH5-37]
MKKLINHIVLLTVMLIATGSQIMGQCKIDNTFLLAGETLQYDLYYKLGLSPKAGWGTLRTVNTTYNGQNAYKMDLITASTGFARKIFSLNDTLTSYMSKDLSPLAYYKRAHEDDDFTDERMTYKYSGNTVSITSTRYKNGKLRFTKSFNANQCTYDMLSVVFYARSLDYSKMAKGTRSRINFLSGKTRQNMEIVYKGAETIKANDGRKYKCYKLVLITSDDAFKNQSEAMTIYISNDANRLPVRIDTGLKVGAIRVILKKVSGTRHPVG